MAIRCTLIIFLIDSKNTKIPVTRQTTYQPDEFRADMKEAIQSEMQTILSEAVNILVEQPFNKLHFLLKRIEALETELTKVTIKGK